MRLARVGGENARATGIGEDSDPSVPRHRLMREQRGDVEQLFEAIRPDHASLPEQRGDDRIARRQRPGV